MGDVFVIGGTVDILSTASISGDLIIFWRKRLLLKVLWEGCSWNSK